MAFPSQCKNSSCKFNCMANRCSLKSKNETADTVFILDKPHQESVELLTQFASEVKTSFAIIYTMRYLGRKTNDCLPSFYKDIKKLQPKIVVFVGDRGLRHVTNINYLYEIVDRGARFDAVIDGVTYKSMLVSHPSALISSSPELIGLFRSDIRRAMIPELRELLIVPGKVHILDTFKKVKEYSDYLINETNSQTVALDLETKNTNFRYNNHISTFQLCDDGKNAYVIPWVHAESPWGMKEQKRLVKEVFNPLFGGDTKFKAFVTHGGMFEQGQIWRDFKIYIKQYLIDTMSCMWLLDENRLSQGSKSTDDEGSLVAFSLEQLYLEFGYDKYAGDPEIKDIRRNGELYKLPLSRLANYGGSDVFGDYQCFEFLKKMAKHDDNFLPDMLNLLKFYFSPVLKMLALMKYNGMPVDLAQIRYLKSDKSPIRLRIKELEKELLAMPSAKKANKLLMQAKGVADIPTLFGNKEGPNIFDISKPAPQRVLFFDVLKLKPTDFGKFKGGNPNCKHYKSTTSKDGLSKTCNECDAVAEGSVGKTFKEEYKDVKEVSIFNELFALKKLDSSYVESFHKILDPNNEDSDCIDQRVRPDQNPHGTLTGRCSTKNPNSAQLPKAKKSPAAKAIKDLFIAEKGCVLIQEDYKTAEVRGFGIISGDTGIASLYNEATRLEKEFLKDPTNKEKEEKAALYGDIHRQTASLAFDVSIKDSDKYRDDAKGVTFGILYGMHVATLASNLGKTLEQTKEVLKKYFAKFKEGKKWLDDVFVQVKKKKYIKTPMGVRRHLPAYYLTDEKKYGHLHARANRQSVNSVIQGECGRWAQLGIALLMEHVVKEKLYRKDSWYLQLQNYVHDAVVSMVKAQYAGKAMKLKQKFLGPVVMEYLTKHFKINFILPIGTDAEIGVKLGSPIKQNFTKEKYLETMKKLGF